MEDNIYKVSYKLKRELQHKIFRAIFSCVLFILLLNLFLHFVIFPVLQKSSSMVPALKNPCVVFVCPLLKEPKRGDLMFLRAESSVQMGFFKKSLDFLCGFFTAQRFFPFSEDKRISSHGTFRRVLALPGDTIYMKDRILFIKKPGEKNFLSEFELSEKKYTLKSEVASNECDGELGALANLGEIVLGSEEYFVLGDNRKICADSRVWGPVKAERFRGKALLLYFPFSQISFFGL